MLYEVYKQFKNNTITHEIVYSKGAYSSVEQDIICCNVNLFKYEYKDRVLPPTLFITSSGKKYIVPSWHEVHPETTLKDIEWIKPKSVKLDPIKYEVTGSNGDKYNTVYNPNTKKWKCNCMGYFRLKVKDKGCKHIQQKINLDIEGLKS